MSRQRALITGINGQDGSYLAEFLLARGYEVFGFVVPAALESPEALANIAAVQNDLRLIPCSLESTPDVYRAVESVRPHECYHLAAQSAVSHDPAEEAATLRTNVLGTHALLSSLRTIAPACRTFFAASSEVFGNPATSPQSEKTPLAARSVYGMTKIAGLHLVRLYREQHGMRLSAGILYNHESPRRGPTFVTRKISMAVARAAAGDRGKLTLGNLDSQRDWGHARDYVDGMYRMVNADKADDYVLATGTAHTVREFCRLAYSFVGLRYEDHVLSDPALFRASETAPAVGDASKAREDLGWIPATSFEDLVREMVEHDCQGLGINISRSFQQV